MRKDGSNMAADACAQINAHNKLLFNLLFDFDSMRVMRIIVITFCNRCPALICLLYISKLTRKETTNSPPLIQTQ